MNREEGGMLDPVAVQSHTRIIVRFHLTGKSHLNYSILVQAERRNRM